MLCGVCGLEITANALRTGGASADVVPTRIQTDPDDPEVYVETLAHAHHAEVEGVLVPRSVEQPTSVRIAALEARIAALEGGAR